MAYLDFRRTFWWFDDREQEGEVHVDGRFHALNHVYLLDNSHRQKLLQL